MISKIKTYLLFALASIVGVLTFLRRSNKLARLEAEANAERAKREIEQEIRTLERKYTEQEARAEYEADEEINKRIAGDVTVTKF